jgi:hypothetical protein
VNAACRPCSASSSWDIGRSHGELALRIDGGRTIPELAVSSFMLSHDVTENACRQNQVANPPKSNRVRFDDIVVATEHVGPVFRR